MSRKDLGKEAVQHAFGGALYQQGRGYYTALELFAIVRGSVLLEQKARELGGSTTFVLPPETQKTVFLRPSHDFARRLMAGDTAVSSNLKVKGEATERTLRALLRGLENPIPGARKPPSNWGSRHFFPFPAELAHYDAVYRRGKVSTETYIFRGGGGLAHKILRTDPDPSRLERTRAALRELMSDTHSAVGRIAAALQALDEVPYLKEQPTDLTHLERLAFPDNIEWASWTATREPTRWFELLREGVDRVLTREDLTDFHRVEVLMHLVPFCLCMHQLAMSRRALERDENRHLVLDAGHGAGAVRELARHHFNQSTSAISAALEKTARDLGHSELLAGSTTWRTGPRSFFTTTCYAVGIANASSGRRFFAVRPAFLKMVTAAFVDGQVPLQTFTRDVLYRKFGLMTDHAAAVAGDDYHLDRADLDANREALAKRLAGLGLLQEYSDATQMVGLSA
jgi:hypothetical protein